MVARVFKLCALGFVLYEMCVGAFDRSGARFQRVVVHGCFHFDKADGII